MIDKVLYVYKIKDIHEDDVIHKNEDLYEDFENLFHPKIFHLFIYFSFYLYLFIFILKIFYMSFFLAIVFI